MTTVPIVPIVSILCSHCDHCAHCGHCAHCVHPVCQLCPLCPLCPLLQVELAKRSAFAVVGGDGSGKLFYVKNVTKADAEHIEVDMRRDMASVDCCAHVHIHKQPCQHMVCVFWKCEMMSTNRKVDHCVKKFWPKWAQAQNVLNAYRSKSIARAQIYGGPFNGNDEDRILPPKQRKKRMGRPKEKRYTYRKRTVKDIVESMPILYHAQYASVLNFF